LVVLLGTVFPLIAQAVNGSQITVGAPYFNRMTMPIVVCLLFLMAVAPVLPWRKASTEVLRKRLLWPAVAAVTTLVACVAGGVRGLNPLLAFGLGAFAGASALRQVVLATRRQGWRGLVGRANGGMIVHLGVVIIAVAFAASHSFAHSTALSLRTGETASFAGHRFTYLGLRTVNAPNRTAVEAAVRVDGGQVYRPAISDYPFASEEIGTPSVSSGPVEDVYLTLQSTPTSSNTPAVVGVVVEPLVMWIWVGGGIILAGTVLSAWPGRRRRRPTDPVSAPAMRDGGESVDATAVPDEAAAPVGVAT
jgi:cytochrome c-type biogenesis protein CcmF